MIFVTIGTQEPFDRLIKAVDELVPLLPDMTVVAQVSKTKYVVRNMKTLDFIPPSQFNEYFDQAQLIISHAGMGTIISALVGDKPIIVMPRLAKFGEHRNDHQLATSKRFEEMGYVNVVYNEKELKEKTLSILNGSLKSLHKLGSHASSNLISEIQEFIKG